MGAIAAEAITRRVPVPGAELHVLEAGEGDPVVLLHGWPQHGHMWRHLWPELAADHRVLVPDLRGLGRSDAPPGDYAKHVFVADLLALLDHEDIERAAIVGHDWGAWTAWLAALEHPERVTRFVSIDVPPPWSSNFSLARFARQLTFGSYQYAIASPVLGERLIRRPGMIERFIAAGSARPMRWDDADLEAYGAVVREPARARASVQLYRTFLLRELVPMARGTYTRQQLEVPALAIFGERSMIRKITGLPEAQPLLEIEVIAGAGHFVPEEKPAETARLVRDFLARRPPVRAAARS